MHDLHYSSRSMLYTSPEEYSLAHIDSKNQANLRDWDNVQVMRIF